MSKQFCSHSGYFDSPRVLDRTPIRFDAILIIVTDRSRMLSSPKPGSVKMYEWSLNDVCKICEWCLNYVPIMWDQFFSCFCSHLEWYLQKSTVCLNNMSKSLNDFRAQRNVTLIYLKYNQWYYVFIFLLLSWMSKTFPMIQNGVQMMSEWCLKICLNDG